MVTERLHEIQTPGGNVTRNMWVRIGKGKVRWLVTDIYRLGLGPVWVECCTEETIRLQTFPSERISERYPD